MTGLDNVAKLVKSGGGVAVMDKGIKKDKLVFKGAVDILDVIASDVGNGGETHCGKADQTFTSFSNGPP